MGRVLAIDYGVRRTGLAVTDPLQIIPGGLTTVETPKLLAFLKDYLSKEQVERFVVGLPKQTNGRDSENLPRVRAFVEQLQKTFPAVPVDMWDERYTSVLAQQAILQSGIGKMARRNKALVDEVSATIILQGWMERPPTPLGANGVFTAMTECHCDPAEGSEFPFATGEINCKL